MITNQLALILAIQKIKAAVDEVYGFSIAAPVLSIESGVGVAVPVLKLIVDDDIPSGYKVRIAASDDADMSSPFETITNPILTADLTDGQIDSDTPGYQEFSAMTSGAKYFQAVLLTDLDAQASGYSNIPTITLVISSATGGPFYQLLFAA